LKICGIASGFAFGYDPTGRSVFFILIDSIPLIENRQFLVEALFKGHNQPTHKSCANMMGFE
jgi:hypothetical protein